MKCEEIEDVARRLANLRRDLDRFARKHRVSPSDIDDFVAKVAETALRAWSRGARPDDIEAWVVGVARQKLRHYARELARRNNMSSTIRYSLSRQSNDDLLVRIEWRQLLAALPLKERAACWLIVRGRLSLAEAAQVLGVSKTSIHNLMIGAQTKLQTARGDHQIGEHVGAARPV